MLPWSSISALLLECMTRVGCRTRREPFLALLIARVSVCHGAGFCGDSDKVIDASSKMYSSTIFGAQFLVYLERGACGNVTR